MFLRERESELRGEEREKNICLPSPRISLKRNLWDQGNTPLFFVALRFAHVTRGNVVYKRRTWVYRLTPQA